MTQENNDKENLGKLLHIRTLNFARREHVLTYLGNRLIAENIHEDIIDDWTLSYLLRRSKTGRKPEYWQHSLFKELNAVGDPEHRTCLVGSPTTLLQEVWVLWRLSKEDEFKPSPAVFSNLWPHPSSHKIFRPFMDGYRERERSIAQAAEKLINPYVVVLDLKKFYPNIDIVKAYIKFENRINKTNIIGDERDTILKSAQGICRRRKKDGLAIGPPLSHVIASIYLEDVDAAMEQAFPSRYFRYVDDVAIVVEETDMEYAEALFREVVAKEKLEINDDKTDKHPASHWRIHVDNREHVELNYSSSFSDLISSLTEYVAYKPEDFDKLREQFRARGFAIPLTRVKVTSEYSSYQHYLVKNFKMFMGFIFGRKSPTINSLLKTAEELRLQFQLRANELTETKLPESGIRRRWAIQELRFTFNRLLYLVAPHELKNYELSIPNIPELAPTKAIYRAMVTGDVSELINYSGPAIAAFAQLWLETNESKPSIDWSIVPKPYHRDSIIVLALYGLCNPSADWINQFKNRKNDYTRSALRVAAGSNQKSRIHSNYSYIDEIESLFLSPSVNVLGLLKSRFDNGESIFLPALSIGEGSAANIEAEY